MFTRFTCGRGIVFFSLCAFSTTLIATEWNGQSLSSGDWSDAGNWAFCVGLAGCDGPESDDTADFGPLGIRTTTNVDYARSIKGIKYELGARLYSISGSELTIGSEGIRNFSLKDQVINNDIKLSANQFWGESFINNLSNGSNPMMEINGSVNLNGHALTVGTPEDPSAFPAPVPDTFVRFTDGFTGSGDIFSYGAILEGSSRFSGRIIFDLYANMIVRGAGASIDGPGGNNAPDARFLGDELLAARRWGILRADEGATVKLDRVIADSDYHGKVFVGADSEVHVGVDGSTFTLNTLLQGDGAHRNSRLIKDGGGTVTINTFSFDADTFLGAGGLITEVRDGTLKLTGNHEQDHDFEVDFGAQLDLDVAQGQSKTLTHRISGQGTVTKTGGGIALLDSNLDFFGDFDMNEGLVFLERDNVFTRSNVLSLNAGVFNLNGHEASFKRIINGAGRVDFGNGELTVGVLNADFGLTILDETDHSGTGKLIKTGTGELDFTYKWGQFNGAVEVQQGTLDIMIASGRRGRADSELDLNMTGGRLEQRVPDQVFRTAQTAAGSVLDLNNTQTTFGQQGIDAGAASRLDGAVVGTNELVKTGLEDLILDDLGGFTGDITIEQGTVEIGNTDINASRIDIASIGELEIGQRVNAVIGSTIAGGGTIVKNTLSTATINNATGFNGQIIVNTGKLATGTSTSFANDVDLHVVAGSFGGGPFIEPIENQFIVNAAQGFGEITGNGIIDFNRSISVGNGDKSSVFQGTLRSSGSSTVTKTGSGLVILDKDQDYRGTTRIEGGELQINGRLHADTGNNTGISSIFLDNTAGDATLSGSGRVGRVSGDGTLAPGESPGILTTHSIIVSNGIDFEFEFTGLAPNYGNADNSVNDVIRMTDFASLTGPLSSENVISLYLDIGSNIDGVSFDGGFFSRRFLSPSYLDDATYAVYVKDNEGSESYGGKTYAALDLNLWDLVIEQVFQNRRFEGEAINSTGFITRFTLNDITPAPIPLPAGFWLLLSAVASLVVIRRRA